MTDVRLRTLFGWNFDCITLLGHTPQWSRSWALLCFVLFIVLQSHPKHTPVSVQYWSHRSSVTVQNWALLMVRPVCFQENWAIGIYRGPSPSALMPLEAWGTHRTQMFQGQRGNPVFSCADLNGTASFAADPFLLFPPHHPYNDMFMFFEVMTLANKQGDIGAAVSHDGGHR